MNNQKPKTSTVLWTTAIIAIAALIVSLIGLKSCEQAGQMSTQLVEILPNIAAKFKTGTITQTFTESIPTIKSTEGDILELATAEADEIFTRTDSQSIGWGLFYIGTTTSKISVRATFRYHIKLSDSWRLATKDQTCIVQAPALRPSLPPAIHTATLRKETENGWLRFNKDENLIELERGITAELSRKAADRRHIALAREECRKSIAAFVKNWLLKEEHWRKDGFSTITVVFPDEKTFLTDQELEQFQYQPTAKLD